MTPHEQEFDFLGHRILVPRSVLESWAALSADKVCRILDSVCVVYMKLNLKWGSAQVAPEVVAEELASGKAALSGSQLWHDCEASAVDPKEDKVLAPKETKPCGSKGASSVATPVSGLSGLEPFANSGRVLARC
jgi:hypothetical protein